MILDFITSVSFKDLPGVVGVHLPPPLVWYSRVPTDFSKKNSLSFPWVSWIPAFCNQHKILRPKKFRKKSTSFMLTPEYSNITPIHKKGDKCLVWNYRPISVLPICGKLFEKLIYSEFYNYLSSNNILNLINLVSDQVILAQTSLL